MSKSRRLASTLILGGGSVVCCVAAFLLVFWVSVTGRNRGPGARLRAESSGQPMAGTWLRQRLLHGRPGFFFPLGWGGLLDAWGGGGGGGGVGVGWGGVGLGGVGCGAGWRPWWRWRLWPRALCAPRPHTYYYDHLVWRQWPSLFEILPVDQIDFGILSLKLFLACPTI